MASAELKDLYKKAIEEVNDLKEKPSNEEQLELYGLFKQGNGLRIADADKPGTFDLKGKAKYAAWRKVAETDKLTADDAKKKYIELVGKLKGKYGMAK